MYDDYYKQFLDIFKDLSIKHDKYQIFFDFMKIASLSIQNSFLKSPDIENDFKQTVKKYSEQEIQSFQKLFGILVMMFESRHELVDILGEIYTKLNLTNSSLGQFFTPDHIAKLMADICFDYEGAKNIIEQNGFVTLSEPTCGSGVMVIAAASALQEQGINYQQDLLAYATDISELCVYITYVQLSLYGIPAIVNCGDSLTSEVRFSLTTPLYFLNYWKFRKANTSKIKETQENIQNQNSLYTFKETVKNGNLQLSFW